MPPARQVRARDEDTLHLQDPRDIRALAHPARMAIVDALASGDELTATECAAREVDQRHSSRPAGSNRLTSESPAA